MFSREKTQASKFSPPKNLKNTQKTNQTNKIHTQNKQTNKQTQNQPKKRGRLGFFKCLVSVCTLPIRLHELSALSMIFIVA